MAAQTPRYKLGAVSFLNPVPLVWGMLHGEERELVDLSFAIPSVCARQVEEGSIEAGLVPVAEIARQNLEMVPGVGISCLGAVRSILLFSRVPWHRVRTLAADLSSRTSVQLARVILRERFGVEPETYEQEPLLEEMMETADAALLIGDSALRVDPEDVSYECLDLGAEWFGLTQLPMVFAAWAGKSGIAVDELSRITRDSWLFGRERMSQIVETESAKRSMDRDLVDRYLRDHIRYELGLSERRGLEAFLEMAQLRPAFAAK